MRLSESNCELSVKNRPGKLQATINTPITYFALIVLPCVCLVGGPARNKSQNSTQALLKSNGTVRSGLVLLPFLKLL